MKNRRFIDLLKCLQALLTLSMEDQATLFQRVALFTLTSLSILVNQRLFLLLELPDDHLKFIRLFLAAFGAKVEVGFQAGKEIILCHCGFQG